ncbi:restriction endonuclease subunit S [Dysgonomonas sp. Marseille-P4677]|uniref:restriction endonuclease subunit S n=1 Tax=Dysgonomonas sp. Marseille-P4677 TaxID=2364790 RepID=UPI001911B4E6|nr:restriction endonuclease subunit S [Dysgonomonas sp. Marseille-P4677]MBK5719883.1 restriction endonuclease subunit S [Dysgonomonas sp. Marseille-P4677]
MRKGVDAPIWKEFSFLDIFEIKGGFYNKKPQRSDNGTIPFLGATATNNGITEFYTLDAIQTSSKIGYGPNEPIESKIFKGNCIAVTNNGSVGYAYYQESDFTCSHDINPLYLKNYTLNRQIALFIITSIEKQRVCFEYARKWRPMRMRKSKLLLPATPIGTPDYKYMETYINNLEKQKKRQYLDYITQRIEGLKDIKNPIPIEDKEWKVFNIKDLFVSQKGDQNNMASLKEGNIPLVSAKKNDNGYKSFALHEKKKLYLENSLTLNNDGDGGAGISFYQPHSYLLDSHVTALYPIYNLNRFILLFISRCITLQKEKFGHGYPINNERLNVFKLMLPINSSEQPDYEYMEQYMMHLEYKKLSVYLEFKKKKI